MTEVRVEMFDGNHYPLLDHVFRSDLESERKIYLPAFDNRNAATPAYIVISTTRKSEHG